MTAAPQLCPGRRLNTGLLTLCIACARQDDGATGTAPAVRDRIGTWQCVDFVPVPKEPTRA